MPDEGEFRDQANISAGQLLGRKPCKHCEGFGFVETVGGPRTCAYCHAQPACDIFNNPRDFSIVLDHIALEHSIGLCASGREWFLWDEVNQEHVRFEDSRELWSTKEAAVGAMCIILDKRGGL